MSVLLLLPDKCYIIVSAVSKSKSRQPCMIAVDKEQELFLYGEQH